MISQGPFTEIDGRLSEISNRKMKAAYGMSMEDFLNLPSEYQDMIRLHYWQTLKENNKKLNQRYQNDTCGTLSSIEGKMDDKISRILGKKKILSLFKKNK